MESNLSSPQVTFVLFALVRFGVQDGIGRETFPVLLEGID